MRPKISIVVALTANRGLASGGNGRAQWYMPEDLRRVKCITVGHPIIIGAKTFQGILDTLGKPLPERTNIVINPSIALPEGCHSVDSLEAGIALAKQIDIEEIFVMGDEELYASAFPLVTNLYLTVVDGTYDTTEVFPDYYAFIQTYEEPGESNGYTYIFRMLTR